MNQLWSWQSLCRTTLEVAPFDGISRFRFKGSSEKFGVLSQRLPCVPLLNYELRPTSTASTHAERSAVPSMRTWTVPLGRFEVEDFAKTNTTVPVRLMTRSPAAISNGKSFPCWNPKRSDCPFRERAQNWPKGHEELANTPFRRHADTPTRSPSPCRSQAAGNRINAKQEINEKTVSGFIFIRRRSCSPVPQESDLLRM